MIISSEKMFQIDNCFVSCLWDHLKLPEWWPFRAPPPRWIEGGQRADVATDKSDTREADRIRKLEFKTSSQFTTGILFLGDESKSDRTIQIQIDFHAVIRVRVKKIEAVRIKFHEFDPSVIVFYALICVWVVLLKVWLTSNLLRKHCISQRTLGQSLTHQ